MVRLPLLPYSFEVCELNQGTAGTRTEIRRCMISLILCCPSHESLATGLPKAGCDSDFKHHTVAADMLPKPKSIIHCCNLICPIHTSCATSHSEQRLEAPADDSAWRRRFLHAKLIDAPEVLGRSLAGSEAFVLWGFERARRL